MMSTHDPFTLTAANGMWALTFRIPMHDPETGETRTAVITLDKRGLWETRNGAAVHGVRVTWANEQNERTAADPKEAETPQEGHSQPAYGANGADGMDLPTERTERAYGATEREGGAG